MKTLDSKSRPTPVPTIEELAVGPSPRWPASPFVGDVVDSHHPSLAGRVLVAWPTTDGSVDERWLPALHGLALRRGDRVIVTMPSNWAEPVVTGVIDGFAARPDPDRTGPTLALLGDERLRVTDATGQALVDLVATDEGPVVRILRTDVAVSLAGKLRVEAGEIELVAREGEARVVARDDLVLRGETISLN